MLAEADWDLVIDTIRDGDCVPFLGAGASMGFAECKKGLPTGTELARRIATECKYKGAEPDDFLRVCQVFEERRGMARLREFIVKQLSDSSIDPSPVHAVLAKLPISYVLTTNYDYMMERAFSATPNPAKSPVVVNHAFRSKNSVTVPDGTENAPVVYKLHGGLNETSSMVCTEDDVVHFLAGLIHDQPPLPLQIKRLFQTKSFLFIGYGLKDWNIRVMIRTMRWENPQDWVKSFAIQRRPIEPPQSVDFDHAVFYWDRKEGIRCFDEDAAEFIAELSRRFDLAE